MTMIIPEGATRHQIPVLGPKGFYDLSYLMWAGEWTARPLVFCLHALTRSGGDFTALAAVLEKRDYRIAAPDLPGRGESSWLDAPADYSVETYLGAMTALIARLNGRKLSWVGTSLGGIVGMVLASMKNSPIKALVINDVGAFVPKSALSRIGDYLGKDPFFEDFDAAEAYLRDVHAPFGALTDDQWRDLTERSLRRDGSGFRLHYDPKLAEPFVQGATADLDLWPVWSQITCPVLIIRGQQSDLLGAETADKMVASRGGVELMTVADTGHAPPLVSAEQTSRIADWLDKHSS